MRCISYAAMLMNHGVFYWYLLILGKAGSTYFWQFHQGGHLARRTLISVQRTGVQNGGGSFVFRVPQVVTMSKLHCTSHVIVISMLFLTLPSLKLT